MVPIMMIYWFLCYIFCLLFITSLLFFVLIVRPSAINWIFCYYNRLYDEHYYALDNVLSYNFPFICAYNNLNTFPWYSQPNKGKFPATKKKKHAINWVTTVSSFVNYTIIIEIILTPNKFVFVKYKMAKNTNPH